MAIITEDHVSFEIAKLLKEKGFDEELDMVYSQYGDLHKIFDLEYYNATYEFSTISNSHYNDITSNKYNFFATAPTLQMAMKWLRERQKIAYNILVIADGDLGMLNYSFEIQEIDNDYRQSNGSLETNQEPFETYEQACEAAIKYCLKNLI